MLPNYCDGDFVTWNLTLLTPDSLYIGQMIYIIIPSSWMNLQVQTQKYHDHMWRGTS
ncbi:hypothetical protein BJ165DRAFT_1478656 [Panaeolus papilionaceus]|nr:hypothetical protein BJ165DRAFT_1478656 [Panaeolus papilionaceus]